MINFPNGYACGRSASAEPYKHRLQSYVYMALRWLSDHKA